MRWVWLVLAGCGTAASPGKDAPADSDPVDSEPVDSEPVDSQPVDTTPPSEDGDDDGAPVEVDCDDADPTRSPTTPERCADGVDQDCDARSECPAMCDLAYTLPAGACEGGGMPAGAALHWPLDGDSLDRSGSGDDGGAAGTVVFEPGVLGQAAVFAGAGSISSARTRDPSAFLVAAWLRSDAFPSDLEVDIPLEVGNRRDPSGGLVWMLYQDQHVGLRAANGVAGAETWVTLYLGEPAPCWRHVMVRHDAGQLDVWIDGARTWVGVVEGGVSLGPAGLWIGGSPTSAGHAFHGAVDEVVWYDRALTDAEALAVFRAAQCAHAP